MKYDCDVIIPIYNAYDCVILCIESVIKNTKFTNNKLILINDKSTDKRISGMLSEYAKRYDFIDYLENKENKGFVGTVNKGMKYSKNDVVLLNSDTEVTPNWLDKMSDVAYSEKYIATVTPLSNNATLVSVPVGLQENDIPSNMTLNEYSKIIELSAFNSNNELPTGHGFCLYIKREVLNLIGYFDEETFGRGYGEENDFCFRCLDYGYKNVLCDNTIIYHKEKQSFNADREKLIKVNLDKLHDRYPIYSRRIELWCGNFPIKKHCENIDYQIKLYKRKNILFLIHDFNDYINNIGGTTIHAYDLIKELRSNYNFHVLAPSDGIYKLYSFFEDSEKITKFDAIDSYNITPKYNRNYKKMIENIVDAFRIDLVHIHHMIGHYFDIIDILEEKNIYSVITLHDFYSLCPSINLLYKMEKYCPMMEDKDCSECIYHKTGIRNNVIDLWKKDWEEFLNRFNKIIVPSDDTKKQIINSYNKLNINVIEHGINLDKNNYIPKLNDEFNIAFVGVMSIHKGGKILSELKKTNKNVKFHLFGTTEFKELEESDDNYIYHGRYKREDLPRLLKENNINLICSCSIWAETYSYTLTEEIASGVPVLSFDIGAVGDRIKKNNIGWVIPISSTIDEISNKIDTILENKDEYEKIIENISKYHIKTLYEMGNDYKKIYDIPEIHELSKDNAEHLRKIIENNYEIKETVSSSETAWILNSLKWRIVSKIKVPNFVKKIARKIMR